jgi:hypothetical protein
MAHPLIEALGAHESNEDAFPECMLCFRTEWPCEYVRLLPLSHALVEVAEAAKNEAEKRHKGSAYGISECSTPTCRALQHLQEVEKE